MYIKKLVVCVIAGAISANLITGTDEKSLSEEVGRHVFDYSHKHSIFTPKSLVWFKASFQPQHTNSIFELLELDNGQFVW